MAIFKNKQSDTGVPVPKIPTEIKETKCTCSACGSVWYYGKDEVRKNNAAKMNQAGKAMMCCGGCFPALFIPNQQVLGLDKCPKCGSKAVRKEVVTHYV